MAFILACPVISSLLLSDRGRGIPRTGRPLPAAGTETRGQDGLTVLFRSVIGLLIIMAALVILAIMRLDSIPLLAVPGNMILFAFTRIAHMLRLCQSSFSAQQSS